MNGRAGAILGANLLLVCACAEPAPEPQPLTVGLHQLELVVPDGWQHYDHGLQQRFENGTSHITLTDLGPVVPDSLLREIEHAHGLFRQDRSKDARAILYGLSPRSAFPSQQSWETFETPWDTLRRIGGKRPIVVAEVEGAFTRVIAQISALSARDFRTIAVDALEEMFQGAHRQIARREAMAFEGRDALLIDTWDRLTHNTRKRYLFILSQGNLLVARMELGKFSEMEPVFDTLVTTLRLVEPQKAGS